MMLTFADKFRFVYHVMIRLRTNLDTNDQIDKLLSFKWGNTI